LKSQWICLATIETTKANRVLATINQWKSTLATIWVENPLEEEATGVAEVVEDLEAKATMAKGIFLAKKPQKN